MATNDIVLSASSRANLLSLQSTQKLIDMTQLRLATGKKVNSALDNPQSFFQSQALSNRAGDLTRLLDGIGQSIRTIEEADKGVSALTSLVEQAGSIADAAQSEIRAAEGFSSVRGDKDLRAITNLQSAGTISGTTNAFQVQFINAAGTIGTADITVTATNIYSVVAAINADTDVNTNLRASINAAGQLQIDSLVEGGFVRVRASAANGMTAAGFDTLGLSNYITADRSGAAAAATILAGTAVAGRVVSTQQVDLTDVNTRINGVFVESASLNEAGWIAADADDFTLTLTVDGTSATTAALTGASTIGDLVDRVNGLGLTGVTASYNTDTGRIDFTFADGVGKATFQINDVAGGITTNFGFGSGYADGVAIATGQSAAETMILTGSSADLRQYESDYNTILDQIDDLVQDANYRGVNLLGGDNLTTFFNEDSSSSLVTEGIDFTSLGLGLADADFTQQRGVQLAIDAVRSALDQVRNFGSSIANDLAIMQARQTFTTETINTLKAGAADLVNADLNEEGANLLALQTAQQLGVTSLSLASQSQQSVLRLF